MSLNEMEQRLTQEWNRCMDKMSQMEVGSKEYTLASNAALNTYRAMGQIQNESEKIQSDAILKDRELDAKSDTDKQKLELEKAKIDHESDIKKMEIESKAKIDGRKLDIEKEKVANEARLKEKELDSKSDIEGNKLSVEKEKAANEARLREKELNSKSDIEGNKLEFEKDRFHRDHEHEEKKFEAENQLEWERYYLDHTRVENDMAIRSAQTKADIFDTCMEGAVAVGKVLAGVALCGAVLSFEQNGCVTSKTISWVAKMII